MSKLTREMKKEMYWTMLLSRRLDERAWVLHRQGKIAFHISGIGHEAAQVGSAFALDRGVDWVAPYYRDLAILIALGYSPRDFMLSLMGKKGEPTSGGRQMPSHFSLRKANVVTHSAPVATQCVHASGIGLAMKLRGDKKAVLTSIGEGSTSQGEWYEAVNWAAVHRLPVVFLIQNNMYAISSRPDKQMAVKTAAEKACGLGLDGIAVDGSDVFEVYRAMDAAFGKAREGGGPSLIEARMYRITPHSSDDDDRSYRSREEVEESKKRDPLPVARAILEKDKTVKNDEFEEMDKRAKDMVDEAVVYAMEAPYPEVEEAAYPVYFEEVRHV